MNEESDITLTRKEDGGMIRRSITIGEKRSTSYLPIIFLIALVTVILIDVLNG